jgi:hypothetical protein
MERRGLDGRRIAGLWFAWRLEMQFLVQRWVRIEAQQKWIEPSSPFPMSPATRGPELPEAASKRSEGRRSTKGEWR